MTVTWTVTTVPHIRVSQNNGSEDNGLVTLPERTVSEKKHSLGQLLGSELLDNAGSLQVGSSPHLHKKDNELFRRSIRPYKHVLFEYFFIWCNYNSVSAFSQRHTSCDVIRSCAHVGALSVASLRFGAVSCMAAGRSSCRQHSFCSGRKNCTMSATGATKSPCQV